MQFKIVRCLVGRAGLALACALALSLASIGAQAEPDAERLGAAQGYPIGSSRDGSWYRNPYRVGSWSAMDQVYGARIRRVPAAETPRPLPAAANPPEIRWRWGFSTYTLEDYLERQRTMALVVIKDGQIVAEHYRYGRRPDQRFLAYSMSKSVVSLLVGIAQFRGHIASLDDPAEKYAAELAGSPYGATPIRHLLRMSSGLTFTERYDGNDDVSRMSRAMATQPDGSLGVLRSIEQRHSPSGSKFVYASAETDVLGRVLRGATGRTLAELTGEWLWKPMGAEHEAYWGVARDGREGAHGAFNASARDWARLAQLLIDDGRRGDVQVLPREYLLEATDPARQPAAFHPRYATRYFGYGYQFWLHPARARTFVFQGVFGQAIYVQPASRVAMVLVSVWEHPSGAYDPMPGQEREALWRGVVQSLGGSVD